MNFLLTRVSLGETSFVREGCTLTTPYLISLPHVNEQSFVLKQSGLHSVPESIKIPLRENTILHITDIFNSMCGQDSLLLNHCESFTFISELFFLDLEHCAVF